MTGGPKAPGTMEDKLCATVTRRRSHGQYKRTVPTRAECSTHAANHGSSSVASSCGPMRMYHHQVVLVVLTTVVDLAAVAAMVTVVTATVEAGRGGKKLEMPLVTRLRPRRNHATVGSATCLGTPESLVHSGDSDCYIHQIVSISFYNTQTGVSL